MNRSFPCLFSLFFLLLLFYPLSNLSAEEKPAIRLGMSAAFTGTSRALGRELYQGAMAYIEKINARGGIRGHRIELIAYDDGYNPEPMITNTITLVEKDNVLALFGYVGTPTTTRVLPLLKHYRDRDILLLFPFTGAEPLREPPYDTYIFNLRGSYFQETRELVENFLAIGRNRIGVFYQIDAYGRSGWDGVRRALKSHGLKIVSEATYIRGATFEENMLKQVEILRSGRPDAIISIGSYNACAAFIRDARKTGWQVPIANLSFVNSRRMLEILISGGHGSPLFTTNLVNSQVMPSYDDLSLPAIREYMADMLSSRRTLPENIAPGAAPAKISLGRISLEGYLNAKVLCMALEKMNNPLDRSQLREALSSLTDIDIGINHPIHYTDTDHQGFKHIYFTTIQDGTDVPMTQGDWNSMRK